MQLNGNLQGKAAAAEWLSTALAEAAQGPKMLLRAAQLRASIFSTTKNSLSHFYWLDRITA